MKQAMKRLFTADRLSKPIGETGVTEVIQLKVGAMKFPSFQDVSDWLEKSGDTSTQTITADRGYRASGSIFRTLEDATEYLARKRETQAIRALLPKPIDPDNEFKSGNYFIRHSDAAVSAYKTRLRAALAKYHGENIAQKFDESPAYAAMYINGALAELCQRLDCVDGQNREWLNPEYARHPEKSKQIEWTKVE